MEGMKDKAKLDMGGKIKRMENKPNPTATKKKKPTTKEAILNASRW